jgi:outer membrane lipoprotein-sorting protein
MSPSLILRLIARVPHPLVLMALIGGTSSPASSAPDLLERMAAVNPNLHAFTATMHANVVMKSFPFLSTSLTGTYYHKEPDKTKVVFTSGVPLIASQFDKLYARIESPSQWPNVYEIALSGDDGTTTSYRLVPRKHGNVDHIEAKVDDKTATVTSMRWVYANGGYAEMTNHYGTVDGNTVVTSQTGHVEEPGYVADVTSTMDHYTINPKLADSVFAEQ